MKAGMRVYLASSWRNIDKVRIVGNYLCRIGYEIYDFTDPGPETELPNGFHWREIDPDWQQWGPEQYRAALQHPLAQTGLKMDFKAMQWADACVAIQPFGRSASLELGWFIGQGKPTIVLLNGGEPELMFGLATKLCLSRVEVADALLECLG